MLRQEASRRLEQDWLTRWWCQKFNRPRKDPLLDTYTHEELFIEYMEDLIEKDPSAAFPPETDGTTAIFQGTGDPLIDKWEREMATGKVPSIVDDMAGSDEEVKRWLTPKAKRVLPASEPEVPAEDAEDDEFHDTYGR